MPWLLHSRQAWYSATDDSVASAAASDWYSASSNAPSASGNRWILLRGMLLMLVEARLLQSVFQDVCMLKLIGCLANLKASADVCSWWQLLADQLHQSLAVLGCAATLLIT